MKMRIGIFFCLGAVALVVAGCRSSSTTQPSGTGSVTAPRGVLPAPNSAIPNLSQPVTLSIANALTTQGHTVYIFEVATDSGFASKVQTKGDVAEGAGGMTGITLTALAPGADYYWHAKATSGGTDGLFGPTYKFTIGPAIAIGAASLVSPAPGAQTAALPDLVFNNATKTGPAGPVTYHLEVSASAAFVPLVVDVILPEGSGGKTTYSQKVELPAETTIYWRVTAADLTNNISGPTSASGSFVTTYAIDLSKVIYLNSPNISGWPRTGTLQSVEQDGNATVGGPLCTKFTDPGWPDSPWPYGGTDPNFGVFANQWYFAKINGVWYGGAGEWIYRGAGACKAGQGTFTIGPDSGFGYPFSSWSPKVGELVGFMISSVARNGAVSRTVDQRTNVIVQPWRDTSLGSK
jgi:hypothetical protein